MIRKPLRAWLMMAPLGCAALAGCHNRDSIVFHEVTWTCPAAGQQPLPRERGDDGEITDDFKRASAVRFYLQTSPDVTLDLYQPGLCFFLQARGEPRVRMDFELTRSPRGTLLSYEATAVAGRDLASALPVRSSLYVAYDKKELLSMDKADQDRIETEFIPMDRRPITHMAAEDILR